MTHMTVKTDTASKKIKYCFSAADSTGSLALTTENLLYAISLDSTLTLHPPLFTTDDQLHQGENHIDGFLTAMIAELAKNAPGSASVIKPVKETGSPSFTAGNASKKRVTSVQMWTTHHQRTAHEWAQAYFQWLGPFTKNVISIRQNDRKVVFQPAAVPIPLLTLEKNTTLKLENISEWIIQKGILNGEKKQPAPAGRLWFVVSPEKHSTKVWTALTHFKPALPWIIYKGTQGLIHPWVMDHFGRAKA